MPRSRKVLSYVSGPRKISPSLVKRFPRFFGEGGISCYAWTFQHRSSRNHWQNTSCSLLLFTTKARLRRNIKAFACIHVHIGIPADNKAMLTTFCSTRLDLLVHDDFTMDPWIRNLKPLSRAVPADSDAGPNHRAKFFRVIIVLTLRDKARGVAT